MNFILHESDYLRSVLNNIPTPVFVVDKNAMILDGNTAAAQMSGDPESLNQKRLCGHILHCFNAFQAPEGCGTSNFCPECIIRKAIDNAVLGVPTIRGYAQMKLQLSEIITDACFLVSAVAFEAQNKQLIMVTLEDITELMELQSIIPMCSHCRKIRDDENFWHNVEDYLQKHSSMRFSHGLCPECLVKLYPEYSKIAPKNYDKPVKHD
jgi:hypothetical protein